LIPGYSIDSIGWHGDDGYLYVEGNKVRQLTTYSAGDQVGIGITQQTLFFTLNGYLIYYSSYK